ncbi:Crp/Fnr family transcriptional regulator [uncultured Oscillibacter sp.]|uniref:Crp/Fnr family transcriptional regulator n=1 Tax=uncultured Oscillibacter sp. TaxID=876091 RepID=UPI0026019FA3|nr:Crp/Fnr family transcriptional regulator [uncultured Oscillibacter sp.]
MKILFDKLNGCPLFSGIAEQELPGLLDHLEATTGVYEKNTTVFWEGGRATFGIVLSGGVHIVREDCWGNRSVIARIDAPQPFGEACAFAGVDCFPASVIAANKSEILLISVQKMLDASGDDPRIIQNLLRLIAGKNLLLKEKIEYLSIRTTKEKLMVYLTAQAKAQGSRRFTIPFDRQALADYLGVERSAMSAELGKLRAEGKIEFKRNHFEILCL